MRVAILADIHANVDALRATLSQARREGAEQLLLLGDYVGYDFEAEETIEALLEWPLHAVRGNHDRILVESDADQEQRAQYHDQYGPSLDYARHVLSARSRSWLAGLPETLMIAIGDTRFLLSHGSPGDPDRYVYWNSDVEILHQAAQVDCDAVLMGHTHHSFFRPGRPWLYNPGSVGQARDLGGFACWGLFDADRATLTQRRTPFDVAPVLQRLALHGMEGSQHAKALVRNNPALAERTNASSIPC